MSITTMKTSKSPGVLYLCATPIGNLEDITYRAVRLLTEASLIAAEDTRRTRQLLAHFDIHTPLVGYHEHNKKSRGSVIVDRLLSGENVVCVSDAGLPGISDPGADLVKLAIDEGVKVVPVPGANAALSGLIASGLDTARFSFVGFLPRKEKRRRLLLVELSEREDTLIFYEAPHRLRETLLTLLDTLGDREAVLARELTKKFEEFIRGTLASLCARFEEESPRGEFVVMVSGRQASQKTASADDAVALVHELVKEGLTKKEAVREAARRLKIPRRDVYGSILADDACPSGGG